MIEKRYMIIALVTVTVLLGSMLVSNLILAQTGGEYDPWLDYNEDGLIDVDDLSPLAQSYGSSGDPTRTVHIKHSTFEAGGNFLISPMWYESIQNETRGYKEVTVWLYLAGPAYSVTVDVAFYVQEGYISIESFTLIEGHYQTHTFIVKGSSLKITIYNDEFDDASVYWRLYVTT